MDGDLHAGRLVQRLRDALRARRLPDAAQQRAEGQYIGNPPVVEFDGDTATGIQHYVFIDQSTHEMRLGWYNDEFARTSEGWRIRRRSTTFMRRNGTFDAGNAHDPSRYVAGTEID